MAVLETKRLRLEQMNESHFEELVRLLANEKVHAFWPEPKTKDRQGARRFFERIMHYYREIGYALWVVIRKEDDQFLGLCGLIPQEVNGKPEVEVGYRLEDRYWGNGYAPEAALGCMNYGREKLRLDTIISLISPENSNSNRVAEKNGMVPDGETMHGGSMHTIWRYRWQ